MHIEATNALSAWALLVSDASAGVIEDETGLPERGLSALVLIRNRPGRSVGWLHREIGLTQSGAVRLLDRLQELGLVTRRREPGRREVALTVTETGEERAHRGVAVRAAAIERLMAPLSDAERARLAGLISKSLAGVPRERDVADVACRLCDWDGCSTRCPLDAAVRAADGG